uniref:Ig-like domain-containing protein n=1 Tax=Neolamprologus brichardi TaxID=32507 RepID=A0A3Q4IC02_NEOBR
YALCFFINMLLCFVFPAETKPSLRKEMDEVTAKLGQPAVMKCQIIGRPVPEIKWYHAGKEIIESRKYEMSSDGRNHSLADDGTYRCKVVNEYGEDSAYAELFISSVRSYRDFFTARVVKRTKRRVDTARMLQKPPEFTLPLVNHTAYMGEDVRFGVTITVHPEPRVIWHKSGQKLIPGHDDKKYTFISDKGLYQLIIHNVETEDDAEYSVVARNRYGDDSCKARLTVVPRPKPADLTLRPMFKRVLANIDCKEGQNIRFEIRVSGRPSLKWEKDGTPLAFGPSIEVVHEGLDYYILHVKDTLPEDSGVYRVTATNSAGSASCQATLKVERTTHVKKEYEPSEKEKQKIAGKEELDKKVRLSQILAGTVVTPLPPAVKWFHNGKQIHLSSKYTMTNISGVLTLQIINCMTEDSGTYRVVCKNAKGETSDYMTKTEVYHVSSSKTLVTEKPSVPAKILTKPQSLTLEEGHTARFECDVDGEPAPSISWLREGAVVAPSARHHIVSTQYNSSFEISSVEMSDEGSYTLLVENAGGKQEAHFTLTIRKSESKEKVVAPPRVTSPEAKSPLAKSPEPVKSPQRVKSPEPVKSPQRVKNTCVFSYFCFPISVVFCVLLQCFSYC